jgi:hypothetical protein
MEVGALFNQGFLGQGFSWWIGQIPDDSTWRDNIIPGKFDNKEEVKGWGRRYKVRIVGIHDQGEATLPSDQLPWAQVMYPITAGGGQGEVYQTPGIRQGNFVFGFFMDGPDGQVPVIMGILGNNTQTALQNATSLQGSSPKAKNFSPISGFAPTVIEKLQTIEVPPKESLSAKRPSTKEQLQEEVNVDNIGGQNWQPTADQQADIDAAQQSLDKLEEVWKDVGKELDEIESLGASFVASVVKQGVRNRTRQANSPTTPPKPGPTKENSDNPHLTSAGDVERDDKYKEKIVLLKPDDIVASSITATQTAMDNLAVKADKYFQSMKEFGYIEAVSGSGSMADLRNDLEGTAKEIAKYMKVPFNKMMEYTEKTINKELQGKVSEIPACMRFQLADVTDMTGESMLESYGKMTQGLENQIKSIMDKMFPLDDIRQQVFNSVEDVSDTVVSVQDGFDAQIVAAFVENANRAPTQSEVAFYKQSNNNIADIVETILSKDFTATPGAIASATATDVEGTPGDVPIQITVPKVPVCSAEDLLGRLLASNKETIDKLNKDTVTQLNYFLEDIKGQIGGKPIDPNALPQPEHPEGAIISQNDEEVLNQTRGGSKYTSTNDVSTYWYTNINPGITTSPGRGATVKVGVNTGGLGANTGGDAKGFTWIERGTGYTNPGANAVNCTVVGSGSGSGMKVNYTTYSPGDRSINQIFVHTAGENYEPNTLLRIDDGNFDAQFILDEVYGPVNPGGIGVLNPGSKYQVGDVIAVYNPDSTALPATFTITATNDPGQGKAEGGSGQSLSDIIGLIGNLSGNVSSALNFENIKSNIFPFELPPKPALSDLYQFGKGGSGQEQPQLPSFGAVGDFVNKVEEIAEDPEKLKEVIPLPDAPLPFLKPSMGEPDLVFNGDNVDTVTDTLRDLQGNLIDSTGKLIKKE